MKKFDAELAQKTHTNVHRIDKIQYDNFPLPDRAGYGIMLFRQSQSIMKEEKNAMTRDIEQLLQTDCWIIDILPAQVPADSPGQYFAVEKYFLETSRFTDIKQRHINLVLKLNCYMDVSLDGEPPVNPPPEQIARAMRERYVYIMLGGAMILSEKDDTHLSLFNPDEKLLELVREIARGEGLYVWRP